MSIATPTASTVKDQVQAVIEERSGEFVRLAHDIHARPELAFDETYAAARISGLLAEDGFTVRLGVFGLPTAFDASIGNGPLHVAFCAEYDALDDGIGHGYGHNLVAGAAVAAAIGLRAVVDEVGLTVSVIGTPGEELIGLKEPPAGHLVGGKIILLEAGAFDNVHLALMVHPGATPYGEVIPSVAGQRLRARFSASAVAGCGLRPAEAKALGEVLRRALLPLHVPPCFCRVEPEGEELGTQADILLAASSITELEGGRDRVRRCLEAAASAAGVAVEVTEYVPVAELRNDPVLAAAYRKHAKTLGRARELDKDVQEELRGLATLFLYRTDLGNVSQVIPAICPMIGIGGTASQNTAEFTAQADTDEAYRAMLDGGVALAWTALDAATDPTANAHLLDRARLARVERAQGAVRWSS